MNRELAECMDDRAKYIRERDDLRSLVGELVEACEPAVMALNEAYGFKRPPRKGDRDAILNAMDALTKAKEQVK